MICDLIFKACDSDDSQWPAVTPFAFWADCTTTQQSMGHSPFYMVHGVEPILPFDLVQATFLIPDLMSIHDRISASQHTSARQFKKHCANTIHDYDFSPSTLVLVHNSSLTMDKMKPQYLGPMVVLRHTRNGAY